MDMNEFKKKAASRKDKVISIRIKVDDKIWLDKNKISPTKIFDNFLEKARKSNK